MAQDIKVFLDLSDEAQAFLEQQHINLYEELQEAEPALRLRVEPDPDALPNSRGDLTTVILAVATLASSLTPLIVRILNRSTPPDRSIHWEVEETETRHPDGTVVVQRKRIGTRDEQRPWTALPSPDKPSSPDTTDKKPQ